MPTSLESGSSLSSATDREMCDSRLPSRDIAVVGGVSGFSFGAKRDRRDFSIFSGALVDSSDELSEPVRTLSSSDESYMDGGS